MSSIQVRFLADLTRAHAMRRADQIALWFEGTQTTYGELDRRANQVANGLLSEGLPPGSRVAVLSKNTDAVFELVFGAAKAGQTLVVVNWRLAPQELSYILNDAGVRLLFVGSDFYDVVNQTSSAWPTVKKIVALEGSSMPWESYAAWRGRQSAIDPQVALTGSDVVVQLYTSGTTGRPKGAQLTSDNLLALVSSGVNEFQLVTDEDVSLVCMPLFHIGGLGYGLVGLYGGGMNVILREVIPADILRAIATHRVSKVFLVPAVILFLLQAPEIHQTDLSSLKLICYGASPMPLELLRRAMAIFPCGFGQVYGLTETTGAITFLPPEDHTRSSSHRVRSCGKPFSTVQIRVVDAEGRDLPVGQVGQIITRSPQTMKGYWNLPEETAQAIRDGWFYTGDAGYLDEDGYLYIHDRVKDMIISGGENIYPAEVENVLFNHPAVADVAVIGVPDEQWGEAVKAIVVKKPDVEVTADELIAFAKQHIAGYKAPKSVDFVEALPRNASGKILKRELRAPYWAGRERQVN